MINNTSNNNSSNNNTSNYNIVYNKTNNYNKIAVFDLDETLGYFEQLAIFWRVLDKLSNNTLTQTTFEKVLDLFDCFLRPFILNILKFVIDKRDLGECDKIVLYTNNKGDESWVNLICNYFNNKLNTNVFDEKIQAFKKDGKIFDTRRKSSEKTINDLIYCTKIPKDTIIYFLDDTYYVKVVESDEVFFYHCDPSYKYVLPFQDMAERYYAFNYDRINMDETKFIQIFLELTNSLDSNYDDTYYNEIKFYKAISKHILFGLEKFFSMAWYHKRKGIKGNKKKTKKDFNKKKNC